MSKNHKSTRKKLAKTSGSRPTIGFLLGTLRGKNNYNMWNGVIDVARERDVNVISFMPRDLESPIGFEAQANVLYDMVSVDRLDGLLVWTAPIINKGGPAGVKRIIEQYRSLPIVAIEEGGPEDIPRVILDNYGSIREVIAHLIEMHGCRRIAFIRGPDETHLGARERHRAYVDVLAEYGLPFDPDLVSPPTKGLWGPEIGEEAITLLLDQRHVDFDAVVGANDNFARGAINALQARKIHVPNQVAVVGFDNEDFSSYLTPPLTTASLQSYELGRQAVEMLLALIEGQEVPPQQVTVPVKLVIRQSCACLNSIVAQAVAGPVTVTGKPFATLTTAQKDNILTEMKHSAEPSSKGLVDPAWAEELLAALLAELKAELPGGGFLSTLDTILRQVIVAGGQVDTWQQAVSALRRSAIPYVGNGEVGRRAEDLWLQAQLMIGEVIQRVQGYQALQSEKQIEVLNEIGATLITTFDVDELMNLLAHELPHLGIPGCYLSLYENPQRLTDQSRLMLAYDEQRGRLELETEKKVFPSPYLVPEGMLPQGRPYSMVVEALYFREKQLGFVLFEVGPRKGMIYDMLRDQISNALQGALLLQAREEAEAALERAYAEVEQQVEERTAELQREIAERERLQQEVIEAQQRAIQELSTPIIPILEGVIVMPLIGSIDSLRARDITRALLTGIGQHRARVVILDVTGVPLVDSGVANYLNKTIQAARLKGARTIVTGISEAVAETIVDLGIDWSGIETVSDLQTGLRTVLAGLQQRSKG